MDNSSSEIDTKTNYSLIKQYIFEEKPKVQNGKCSGGARTGYIVRDAGLSKGNIGKEGAWDLHIKSMDFADHGTLAEGGDSLGDCSKKEDVPPKRNILNPICLGAGSPHPTPISAIRQRSEPTDGTRDPSSPSTPEPYSS